MTTFRLLFDDTIYNQILATETYTIQNDRSVVPETAQKVVFFLFIFNGLQPLFWKHKKRFL